MSNVPQSLSYFGRACNVSVTPQGTNTPFPISSEPNTPSPRITFEVQKVMTLTAWQATVTIYNLSASTVNAISRGSALSQVPTSASGNPQSFYLAFSQSLMMGDLITISAGYQFNSGAFNPAANLVYTGNLMQAIATRENVVNTKLILRCVSNLAVIQYGFSNLSRSKTQNDFTIIQQVAANVGLAINYIDPESVNLLQSQYYSRGQAIFDRPINVISDICKQHSLFSWIDEAGLTIRSFGNSTIPLYQGSTVAIPTITYSPPNLQNNSQSSPAASGSTKTTIIGVPQQTQMGIVFRVLMDSQVHIGAVISVVLGTAINGYQFPYLSYPPLPNATGVYTVIGVRHFGDTRGEGDDWYTEINGVTAQYFVNLFNARN